MWRHIFSSAVKGYTSGRRCVTALQSYTAKTRIHLLFSSAKKRYTALVYVRRPCTVAHGLSVRKEKEIIAKKRYTAPMSMYGGVKEKKRKDKTRSKENKEAQTRNSARIELGDKIQLS